VSREWLEADGLGGYACGPVEGSRTRRYHALLMANQGGARFVLVNGLEVVAETAAGRFPLTSQTWQGGVVAPDAAAALEGFTPRPWPRWTYRLPDGTRIAQELFVRHGQPQTFVAFSLLEGARVVLRVRPFISGRDYHALHHENPLFQFEPERQGEAWAFRPYPGVPAILLATNGEYRHEPLWYRSFLYSEEAARGLDCVEDLASPGEVVLDLGAGEGALVLAAGEGAAAAAPWLAEARAAESARRWALGDGLAADAYLVATPAGGKTIIAGYPWFTDWGRDTFIAVRGLCLATGRHADAAAVLLRWTEVVSEGMLPNRFPDGGGAPEYNSVDAALWFVVAAGELAPHLAPPERRRLVAAVEAILAGHARGTRYGIRADDDGLLAAGEPGVQLTWMDSKIGDWVVTPRVGKPVEIQALWLNALHAGERLGTASAARWAALLARGRTSFTARFWNASAGALFDVVDVDHQRGTADPTIRPNQIFAVGGLPLSLIDQTRARTIVDTVEARLLTPLGLRSLAPGEPGYRPRYQGGPAERDSAYHQGTVWPWLMGPFVEAWVRVRGGTPAARAEARRRFLGPLQAHLDEAGVGHVSEVADGDPPHRPGGCPFQAWSLGELMRLEALLSEEIRPAREVVDTAGWQVSADG
jgi:predicted glycogen debranching enzyme